MKSRKLGFWESVLCILHDELYGTGIIFNAMHIKGRIDLALLKKALQTLFNKHPLLRATIEKRSDGYYFKLNAEFKKIPIQTIERKNGQTVETLIETELRNEFPTDSYLWRAFLIQSSDLNDSYNEIVFTFHHAIADGLSCVYFIHDLLTDYHQAYENKIIPSDALPLLDPVEKLIDKKLFEKTEEIKSSIPLTSYYYQKYAPLGQRTTKNIYRILASNYLQSLIKTCRARKLKINSAFNAAMLLAAYEMEKKALNLSLLTPVNLRNRCQPKVGLENFGCYISTVTTEFENIHNKNQFWELALDYETKLMSRIETLSDLPTELDMKHKEELSTLLSIDDADTRNHFTSGFVVTNKGYLDFPSQYGPLELLAYYTSSSRQAGDIVINLSITSMLDKSFLCFTYAYPLIETEWAEQFANNYMNLIKHFCKI